MNKDDYSEQYAKRYDLLEEDAPERKSWVEVKPEIKEKLFRARKSGTTDLTHARSGAIKGLLFNHNNIKIYDFVIGITKYHGNLESDKLELLVDISILKEEEKLFNGKITKWYKLFDITHDDRFADAPWIFHFSYNVAEEINADTLVEIIRRMQVVKKLSAFL